jgi:nucleotide-binding universal stress UspA family protein
MAFRTIFVAPVFEPFEDSAARARSLVDYAAALAAAHDAHLEICVGSCAISVQSALLSEVRNLVRQANAERRDAANRFGEELMQRTRAAGVVCSLTVFHDSYAELSRHFLHKARRSDVNVLQPSSAVLSLAQGLVEEVLFGSGRPVMLVPTNWNQGLGDGPAIVAWDGSAKAARALGDAMPLLEKAGSVEIVAVSNDPNTAKQLDGADIAPHVARHAANVRLTVLSAEGGDVASAIIGHARNVRASVLVMGAYGHNRLRQFILGGVTSSMISDPPIPVLLST